MKDRQKNRYSKSLSEKNTTERQRRKGQKSSFSTFIVLLIILSIIISGVLLIKRNQKIDKDPNYWKEGDLEVTYNNNKTEETKTSVSSLEILCSPRSIILNNTVYNPGFFSPPMLIRTTDEYQILEYTENKECKFKHISKNIDYVLELDSITSYLNNMNAKQKISFFGFIPLLEKNSDLVEYDKDYFLNLSAEEIDSKIKNTIDLEKERVIEIYRDALLDDPDYFLKTKDTMKSINSTGSVMYCYTANQKYLEKIFENTENNLEKELEYFKLFELDLESDFSITNSNNRVDYSWGYCVSE